MKNKEEIQKALKEMTIRRKSYLLDMFSVRVDAGVSAPVYNTELIRNLEVTDAVIQALTWVLADFKNKSAKKKK